MLHPQNVLHISKYDFEDGSKSKNKFLIILDCIEESSIILSLTTSQDFIPDRLLEKGEPCIHEPINNIHSYHFPQGLPICINGFAFRKPTFITIGRSQIMTRKLDHINSTYIEKGKVELMGKLIPEHYFNLLKCIAQSRYVTNNIKKQIIKTLQKI